MSLSTDVGRRIKRARQQRNLTLKDIERAVDVSATHVSEIERGKTSPTVGALTKIARAFDLEPSAFLTRDALPEVVVTREPNRRQISFDHTHVTAWPLTGPVRDQKLSVALATWAPSQNAPVFRSHAGEEFVVVLSGRLQVTVRDRTQILAPGDSVHFRADLPHRIVPLDQRECHAVHAWQPVFGL